jgi:hypothetical protein
MADYRKIYEYEQVDSCCCQNPKYDPSNPLFPAASIAQRRELRPQRERRLVQHSVATAGLGSTRRETGRAPRIRSVLCDGRPPPGYGRTRTRGRTRPTCPSLSAQVYLRLKHRRQGLIATLRSTEDQTAVFADRCSGDDQSCVMRCF